MSIDVQVFCQSHRPSVALLTFNNPTSLNAQNTDMVIAIAKHLQDWATDDNIAVVIMRGIGDKAFCAGGDIRSLYHAMQDSGENTRPSDDIVRFFANEYRLIDTLHTYPKPIIAWGDGIVMGGGLGLLAAASHKISTHRTIMAMPEVSIGLFPDAGGSYFLNRMMGKVGLFLGLTGARWSGVDALFLGLADYFIDSNDFDKLLNALVSATWHKDNLYNHNLTAKILYGYHKACNPSDGVIMDNLQAINHLMQAYDLTTLDEILQTHQSDNPFIQSALSSYRHGCPTTKALTWEIYHKVKTWSLNDILALEFNTAIACCQNGDFKEGVRALLIDKNKKPRWRYELHNLPKNYIQDHFVNRYPSLNPFV